MGNPPLALSLPIDYYINETNANIFCTAFFNEECKEEAEEECSEFLLSVPLSEEFDSTVFEHFC